MQSVADASQPLRAKLAAKAAEARAREPRIAQREAEIADVRAFAPTMICPICHGYGLECPHCGGFGLVCPTCRGMRWVSRGTTVPHHQRVMQCPTCTTIGGVHDPEGEQRAIGQVFERLAQARKRQARLDGEDGV